MALPAQDGMTLKIRRPTAPEKSHREIYDLLDLSAQIFPPKKTWVIEPESEENSDGK